MINGKRIVSIITARGGSKGIPHKNILDLCGKPLIAYTAEASRGSKYVDRTIVTTDSAEIRAAAVRYGAEAPFIRPAEVSGDRTTSIETMLHAVKALESQGDFYDIVILLQPTSPLRTSNDLDHAIETFAEHGFRGLASVSEVEDHPLLIRSILADGSMKKLLNTCSTCRRQDMPPFYRVNGAVYINLRSELNEDTSFNDNPIPYIMEKNHSIDIDTLEDLAAAEYVLSHREISR